MSRKNWDKDVNRIQVTELFGIERHRHFQLLANLERRTLYHSVLLGAVLLLAGALRLSRLGEWSFWIDEIYSLQAAQTTLTSERLLPSISTLLMGAAIRSFGVSEWSLRLAPALVGVASLPILYFLVRQLFDRHVALIATLLLAISPWHLYWSQTARFYTTLLLLYLAALITFFWGVEQGNRRFLIISLILLGLAIQERLFALFFIPVVICYVILLNVLPFEKRLVFPSRKILVAVAVPLLVFVLYDTFNVVAGRDSVLSSFLVKFVGNPNKSSFRFLASFVYRLGIPILCLGTVGGFYLIGKREAIGLYLLTSAILPPLLLTLSAPFIFTADRYTFITLPGWIILSAVAIKTFLYQSSQYGRILALALPLIVTSDALAQNVLYYQYQNGGRANWKKAYELIQMQQVEGDVVFASRPEIGTYYLGRGVQRIETVDLDAVAQPGRRTWFVVNSEEVDAHVQQWIKNNGELIEVFDVTIPGNVYSLRLYLYDPVTKHTESLQRT